MSDDDREDDAPKPRIPSQIPLLVDVVKHKKPARVRKKPTRENYSLDLNPEPPTTLDLFAEPAPSPRPKDSPPVARKAPRVPDPDPDIEAEMEARFRRDANELVENLVKQYSEEILHRLREELTSLLEDLDAPDDPDKQGPGDPPGGAA